MGVSFTCHIVVVRCKQNKFENLNEHFFFFISWLIQNPWLRSGKSNFDLQYTLNMFKTFRLHLFAKNIENLKLTEFAYSCSNYIALSLVLY